MSFVDGDGNRRSACNAAGDDPPPEPNNESHLTDALSLNNDEPISEAPQSLNLSSDSTYIPPADSTVSSNDARRISGIQDTVQSLQAQLDQQTELRALEIDALTNHYDQLQADYNVQNEQRRNDDLARITQRNQDQFAQIGLGFNQFEHVGLGVLQMLPFTCIRSHNKINTPLSIG